MEESDVHNEVVELSDEVLRAFDAAITGKAIDESTILKLKVECATGATETLFLIQSLCAAATAESLESCSRDDVVKRYPSLFSEIGYRKETFLGNYILPGKTFRYMLTNCEDRYDMIRRLCWFDRFSLKRMHLIWARSITTLDIDAHDFVWTIEDQIKKCKNDKVQLEKKRLRILEKLEENNEAVLRNTASLKDRQEHLENVKNFKRIRSQL